MFSRFAVCNRYHNAMIVEELLKNCTLAYQKQAPIAMVLESQANINDRFHLLQKEGLFRKMKNLTAPAAFRFQRKLFDGKEMTACFLKGLSYEEDCRAHLPDNKRENHVFIDDAVNSDIFFDFNKMPDFLTKPIPEDEISKKVKNINDCLRREGLFSESQANNAKMIAMGMADEISIPFQWDTSLYLPFIQNDYEDDSDLECEELDDDGYDSEEDPIIYPHSELPIEIFCDLGDMLIINSGDVEEPFWISRSTENVPKSAKHLEVHWYELTARGKGPLCHEYVPVDIPHKYKSRSKRAKRYVSTIDIDTIIMRFSKLDKHNRILAAIRGEYMRMAKSNNLRYSIKPKALASDVTVTVKVNY